MNRCSELFQRLLLLLAIVVGIVSYIILSGADDANINLAMLLISILGAAGTARILNASALQCNCPDRRSFCGTGLLAAIGGAGASLAAFFTLVIDEDAGTAYFIGAAVSFALFTLLLGGMIVLIADSNNCLTCRRRCPCSCDDDDDIDDDDDDCRGRYYRR
ncbi:MAG: hypothetical protein J1F63_07710 [Oscillospiraceae bacterium]|nr:hypothetical protein [Oscillospiraceae bacterium]